MAMTEDQCPTCKAYFRPDKRCVAHCVGHYPHHPETCEPCHHPWHNKADDKVQAPVSPCHWREMWEMHVKMCKDCQLVPIATTPHLTGNREYSVEQIEDLQERAFVVGWKQCFKEFGITEPEWRMFFVIAEQACNDMTNHGCNDFDAKKYMTPKEHLKFTKDYEDWNSKGTDFDPKYLIHSDFTIFAFILHKLKKNFGMEDGK